MQTEALPLTLLSSDCVPIENARVNLRKENNAYVTNAKTDATGIVAFEVLPITTHILEVDYHGGQLQTEPITSETETTVGTEHYDLLLTDNTGMPIENARVNLRKENNAYVTNAKTDATGTASFQVLPNAPHVLETDYNGSTFQTPISSSHSPESVQTLSLGLILTDSNGVPIENARVSA